METVDWHYFLTLILNSMVGIMKWGCGLYNSSDGTVTSVFYSGQCMYHCKWRETV